MKTTVNKSLLPQPALPVRTTLGGVRLWTTLLLGLSVMAGNGSLVMAQSTDTEPNNSCSTPQDMGTLALPHTITGSLDTPPSTPDVDFFKFTGVAGTLVRVDYEGAATGQGTLNDPYLGLFDSVCQLIAIDDDTESLNSRLEFAVPEDGVFIVAATSCCDGNFSGVGSYSGTYKITLATPPPSIGSISGRVVDAVSGEPLRGDSSPWARAELRQCTSDDCSYYNPMAFQNTDVHGQFLFNRDGGGNLLPVGNYQVVVRADLYQPFQTGIIPAGEGENEVGDIALEPIPVIESISGRVVDAVSGEPLSASVTLNLCQDPPLCSYYSPVGYQPTDSAGYFSFSRDNGYFLPVGTYQVAAYANEYQSAQTDPFMVAEEEHKDVGDIALIPPPVQFTDIHHCDSLPPEGGRCRYSVRIVNNMPTRLRGVAWSLIFWSTGYPSSYGFEAGEHQLNLRSGGTSRRLAFDFEVPGTVSAGTYICAHIYVGEQPHPHFNTLDTEQLFCVVKEVSGALRRLNAKETQTLLDQSKGQGPRQMVGGKMPSGK